MIRISLAYLYEAGAVIGKFADIVGTTADVKVMDIWHHAALVQTKIVEIYDQSFYKDNLIVSRQAALKLGEECAKLSGRSDFDAVVPYFDRWQVADAARKFEDLFKAELAVADAYFVIPKGGYNTTKLVTDATVLFPPSLPMKAPEAVPDIVEAGRCLAFELGTSAGFHILRAAESVLRRYWDHVSNNKPRPKQRNIGVYLAQMEKHGLGEAKVISVLRQIKDLHRNALIHPEETLTPDEAINLMGIVRSAVSAMLSPMPEVASPPRMTPAVPASTATPAP
ncbi:MAG: hypothetical protein IKE60_31855 [Reyranella sp.]|uniref:hypothetical protein n=1 Tax=Reyranella sp. TaxID=1929291 RepID=UPI0025D9E3A3|nr:hypothetical protein [Reyranella sp.]MBR2819307.1 hypothetical protein [Reyranella sp.]